jgi:hypothetical protein
LKSNQASACKRGYLEAWLLFKMAVTAVKGTIVVCIFWPVL